MRCSFGQRFVRGALVVSYAMVAALPAIAQTGTIVGRVVDARTNAPLAQASVRVDGTRFGASAGSDGAFRITAVPAGTHTVIAQRIGSASQRRTITVTSGSETTVNFSLDQTTVALDEVVVTGT